MARIRRAGDPQFRSSASEALPRAQEYVHRFTEPYTERSRSVGDVLKGVWGHAPISAFSQAWQRAALLRAPPPSYRRVLRPTRPYRMLQVLQIRVPRRVRFCQQRKERREVLFALGRSGFSGSAPKRHYHRTQDSQWRC